jgi:hypothetical protein
MWWKNAKVNSEVFSGKYFGCHQGAADEARLAEHFHKS